MVSPELIIRIAGNSTKFNKELAKLEARIAASGKKTSKKQLQRQAILERNVIASYKRIARAAKIAAVAAAAGIGISVRNFAIFEQGLAGVSKTTNIVGKDLEDLGKSITDLSIEVGTSTKELLEIAKASGQLGVKGKDNILKFTETIAALGKTTNIQGEAAAISLARLSTITKENLSDVDRLGSVIVDLGNNFAALESEILFTSEEIAGAGVQFGITATQALGLAAAFSELKIRPELARSTIIRSFNEIGKAIDEGGEKLETLIAVTGLTEDQLRTTFKENSVAVFQAFIDGLGKIQKSGASTTQILKSFNLGGIRLAATLPKLAANSDLVREALDRAGTAAKENTATQKELAIQLDTTLSRYNMTKQEIAAVSREIGQEFIPASEDMLQAMRDITPFIRENLVPALSFLIKFLAAAADGFNIFAGVISSQIEMRISELKALGRLTGVIGPEFIGPPEANLQQKADIAQKELQQQQQIFDDQQKLLEDHLIKKEEIQKSHDENETELTQEQADLLQRLDQERKDEQLEDEEEERDKELQKKQEQFDEDMELLEFRLEAANIARDEAAIHEVGGEIKVLKEKAKINGLELKQDNELAKQKASIEQTIIDQKISLGLELLQAAGLNSKALFLVEKAAAIARSIVTTELAYLEALSNPPGPPATIPLAAAVRTSGHLSTAVIAASAITGFSSAEAGGTVPGGFGGGDKVPMLLEPGEIIVPQGLNPLSPNFQETFGGDGGGQNVNLQIGFDEDASRILTVKQREDTTLGIQR